MRDLPESILCLSTTLSDISYIPDTQLLYNVVKSEEPFGIKEIAENFEKELMLVNGDKHAQIITFTSGFISPSREAREYSAMMLSKINRTSVAFVVEHLPVRLILNSFIIFNKPGIPTRMFSTVEQAERWSLQQLGKDC